MNKVKITRDLIIIAIVIVVAVFISRSMANKTASEQTGPVNSNAVPAKHPGNSPHAGAIPDLTAGDAAITMGDYTVGSEWLEAQTESLFMKLAASDPDYDMNKARRDIIAEGVYNLVTLNGLKNNGLEITGDDLAARKAQFEEENGGSDAAQELLDSMGITWDRMEKLWIAELTEIRLMDWAALEQGLEAGSDFAKAAYDEWLFDSMVSASPEFTNSEDQLMFEEHVEMILGLAVVGYDANDPHADSDDSN